MKPKKYPYLGAKKEKETDKEDKLELVVFPNVSFSYEDVFKILDEVM